MTKHADLGDYLLYEGRLMQVIGIANGKMVILRPLDGERCTMCGHAQDVHLLEHSPLFQQSCEPVPTITAGQP